MDDLHPELVPRLVKIVHQAGRALGFQVLMISHHDVSIFEQYADRIYRFTPTPDGVRVDQSYWGHLKLPFVWERLQPGAEPERAAATLGWQIEDAR